MNRYGVVGLLVKAEKWAAQFSSIKEAWEALVALRQLTDRRHEQ